MSTYNDSNESMFKVWMIKSGRSESTSNSYSTILRGTLVSFLNANDIVKTNFFEYSSIGEFEKAKTLLCDLPNFTSVNQYKHNSFSAALKAYEDYLKSISNDGSCNLKNTNNDLVVDFNHTELCAWSKPISCNIAGISIQVGTWRDLFKNIIEEFIASGNKYVTRLFKESIFKRSSQPFFLKERPESGARQLSNGYWIYINYSIPQLVDIIGKLCTYCGYSTDDVIITYTSKHSSCNLKNTNNDLVVDFNHTELCAWSRPISCKIDGISIQVGTWRDLLKNIIEEFIAMGNKYVARLFKESIFKRSSQPFFLKERPENGAKQLSNGYWIYINYSIPQLVGIIGKLCTYCGYSTSDVIITYTSKYDDMQVETSVNDDKALDENGLNAVLGIIKSNYSMGLDFSTTTLRLLENKSQAEISAKLQAKLKKLMFRRNDGIYFLTEQILNPKNYDELQTAIREYMDEFSCFELPQVYIIYSSFFNNKLIRDCDDFEDWLKFSGLVQQTRCAGQYGTRIVRKSDCNIQALFSAISVKISVAVNDNYGGVIEEEQLENIFSPFSTQLLFNIIKDYNENLVRTEINGVVCYQTLDALGLSDDFSNILDDALAQIDDLGLIPNEETLNTVLSITMGLNFRVEYNLMEGKTFRRLIAHYYKNDIKREWRGGVFMEVQD